MSRLIKIIDKDTIEISDYRCSAVLYPEIPPTLQNVKDQIDHCEDWCVFKKVINPFQMYAENERLREVVENLTTMTVCGDRKQIKNTAQFKLDQLQSRIDKAIEYVKNTTLFTEDYDYDYEENLVWNGATDEKEREELLNILQGEDKE